MILTRNSKTQKKKLNHLYIKLKLDLVNTLSLSVESLYDKKKET